MTAELVKKWLISGLISGSLAIWTVLVLRKSIILLCFWASREINSRFCSKTQWQMFLLVSGRHVGAHPDGYQHGGPIQISINLGKKFIHISCIRKIAMTWNLARVFAYSPSFFSQNLDFIYWMVLIFIFNGVTLKTSNTLFRYSLQHFGMCFDQTGFAWNNEITAFWVLLHALSPLLYNIIVWK